MKNKIRKTDENPSRVSTIDVAVVITDHIAKYASEALCNICKDYPDVSEKIGYVKFPDSRGRKGQKNTPVSDAKGIVEIIMLLLGHTAARVRRQAAELHFAVITVILSFGIARFTPAEFGFGYGLVSGVFPVL